MKLFIWADVEHLTGHHHCGGGVAVIAESLEAARGLLPRYCPAHSHDNGDPPTEAHFNAPDYEAELMGEHESKAWIFPNAGCC
jgi:hypothetical protein